MSSEPSPGGTRRGATAPIRVLHLITALDVGGAERMLVRLLERLDRSSFDSHVVSLTRGGMLRAELEATGATVTDLGLAHGSVDPRGLLRLLRVLRRVDPDIIQTWLYHSDLLGTVAQMLHRRPSLVWNLRCGVFDMTEFSIILRIVRRLLIPLSSRPVVILSNSARARDEHIELGYRARRWQIIPNGIDASSFVPRHEQQDALRASFGIPIDVPVVGILGRFDPLKDYRNFLAAAAEIHRVLPQAFFVMAGRGLSFSNPRFAALAGEYDLGTSLLALDEVGDVGRLYPAFDVFCLSSSSESFPNVILEAMACGVPVAATDTGAAREIISDAGKVVPHSDPSALAAAIVELLTLAEDERVDVGARARRRVEECYSLEAVTSAYVRLYQEVYEEAVAEVVGRP